MALKAHPLSKRRQAILGRPAVARASKTTIAMMLITPFAEGAGRTPIV
jgi:hypothetical protein